ncbi:MAG: tetratricopeptide repeat protein [Planctomycetes bacterium]|nr:tetratricopeptide repeat protein [Planctomycetota bacterium]
MIPSTERTVIRKSRTGKWRAMSLILVHVLIIGHIIHWRITGRTLSPVEPSETMYALNKGYINAGLIFFAAALLATLIFGRFVCGWGCHIVAYQDFCGWLLKKIGIKPKAFRSRILVFAPLALALYMFVWPTAYRLYMREPAPDPVNHLITKEFWQTFPGPIIAILTFLVCGFAIVYFLGAKGFCTYGCPYGGFFGVLDQFSSGRIRVTDDCEHCGHCTAVCTSNVRVHEEVAKFGMVVDPGCMKCMDCISVCPNDALYFGFGKPGIAAGKTKRASEVRDSGGLREFTLIEELVMLTVGLASLLIYRGLYGYIPLLMAMGMAAITGYLAVKSLRFLSDANVRLQNLSLKRGGRMTPAGWSLIAFAALVFAFVLQSGFVQGETWIGHRLVEKAGIEDDVWFAGNHWLADQEPQTKAALIEATRHLDRAEQWGFLPSPTALQDLLLISLAANDDAGAEIIVRQIVAITPNMPKVHRGLGGVLRKRGRIDEAAASYQHALQLDPTYADARRDLGAMFAEAGRTNDAIELFREGARATPNDPQWSIAVAKLMISSGRISDAQAELSQVQSSSLESPTVLADIGTMRLQVGQTAEGIADLRRALAQRPDLTQSRYNLALALLQSHQVPEAIEHLNRVVSEKPTLAEAHYNLGVATFMSGDPAAAVPHINDAIRLDPNDPQAYEFLAMLLDTLGDAAGSQSAAAKARSIRK